MSHGLLGPLETVDLHDPLAPLHDGESSISRLSKKSNSLKKPKGTNSFREEDSIRSRSPSASGTLTQAGPVDGLSFGGRTGEPGVAADLATLRNYGGATGGIRARSKP